MVRYDCIHVQSFEINAWGPLLEIQFLRQKLGTDAEHGFALLVQDIGVATASMHYLNLPRPEALPCRRTSPGYAEGWPAMYVASLTALLPLGPGSGRTAVIVLALSGAPFN